MPSTLEAEISSLLREQGDPVLVAENLLQRWRRHLLNEQEQIDCAQFLVAAGLYPLLLGEIVHLIKSGSKLPWAQFAECLGRAGIKPDEFELQALFDAAELQEALPQFLQSRQLDLFSRAFSEKRNSLNKKRTEDLQARKQALMDKLEFMRSHRMHEQQAQVIDEIQALFPEEADIKAEKEALELRWAREIVAKSTSVTDATGDVAWNLRWKLERLPPEQMSAKAMIVERAGEIAKGDPQIAYDLAISLHLMDFNAEAIELLNLADSSPATDWLRLELMIHARQFVNALDEVSRLEIVYAGEPEAAFAAVYARARALHGLGQTPMAVDLLRSLVRIRPQYKSAQSLLMDWSGGDV